MRLMKTILLCLMPSVWCSSVLSQGTGFDLLTIGPNTEALGINEATTAYLLGASDIYANPANLAFEPSSSLNADYSLWIGGLTNTHVAANFKRENSAIGFGLLASEVGDFELRDRPGPSQGSFSTGYLSLAGGYAFRLRNFSAGASFQYLREELYIYNASGYAINAGISSHWLGKKIIVSAALQNVGKMDDLNSDQTQLPTLFRAGFNTKFLEFSPKNDASFPIAVALLSDFVLPLQEQSNSTSENANNPYLNIGVSIEAANIIILRGGYKTGESARPLSFGTGIHINNVTANYAIIPFETGFGTVHAIGIGYEF